LTPAHFTPLAENDLREAFEWYEAKNPELALKFMKRVRETVNAIETNPRRFPIAVNDIRKQA
jgi:plasmid stabilization system protein ParE